MPLKINFIAIVKLIKKLTTKKIKPVPNEEIFKL